MPFKINKKLFRGNLWQFFIYFFCITVTVVLVFASTTKLYFSNVLRNYTVEASNNQLVYLKNAQEVVLQEIDKSLVNIILDPSFATFEANDSVYTKVKTQEKLINTVQANQFFHSVTIYYPHEQMIVSTISGTLSLDDYFDKAYVSEVISNDFRYGHVESRSKFDSYLQSNVNVISMTKTIPLVTDSPTAYVILDIKAPALTDIVDSIKSEAESAVVITDTSGNIIASNKNTRFYSLDKHDFTTENKDSASPLFTTEVINNQKFLVGTLVSSKYGWIYYYLTPITAINEKLAVINRFTVLISVFMMLLSFAASYVLSKRLYAPIKKIALKFDGEGEDRELNIIYKNVDNLITANKNLNDLLADYNFYLKNKYLISLLSGRNKNKASIIERLSYYNINLIFDDYFVVYALSVNFYKNDKEYTEKQKNMFVIYMNETITNELLTRYKGFVVEMDENKYVMVLNFKDDGNYSEMLVSSNVISYELNTLISKSFGHSVTIGVSNICKSIENIYVGYKEADYALNYKLIPGYNNVILYNNINSGDNITEYPFDIENSICNALKSGNAESSKAEFENFVADVMKKMPEIKIAKYFFLQLLTSTFKCMLDMNLSFDNLAVSQHEIYTSILNEQSIDSTLVHMNKLFDNIIYLENEKRLNKNKDILISVKEYIKKNLDRDLSTENLAETFYISPSYLRKIFKDEYNITLKQYIDSERIEYAKVLLKDTSLKANEISQKIGYMSVQSFTRAFKQHTNQTPLEYRNSIIRNQS